MKNYIKKLLREGLVNEYVTKDIVYLRDYFRSSEESRKEYLPHEYHYFFDDFLIEDDIDFSPPKEFRASDIMDEPDEEVDMFDDTIELIIWLEKNDKKLYDSFANYLYKKIVDNTLPIPDEDYPAWSYFDDSPELIKNQWLIHFTDDADSIAADGFKYGVDDMTKLGLTTRLGEFDKKYGGYNFAYTLSDYVRYGGKGNRSGGGYKYGNECVIFRASGIKLWHHGDMEPQVIFYGNTANNIVAITEDEERWAIRNIKNGSVAYQNDDLDKVVNWFIKNYNQYRKILVK